MTSAAARRWMRWLIGVLCAACTLAAQAQLKSPDEDPERSPVWQKVRASLFGGRQIDTVGAPGVLRLEAPARAEDAAFVPVAIRAQFAQTPERNIKRTWLIIDNNPSPIAAIFEYTLASGRADIETRVRIDEYGFVRAIAETNDGKLYMHTRFVKASGGCSAAPGTDAQASLASMGKMKVNVQGEAQQPGALSVAQLIVSHPNHSGLAMDQYSRQFTPKHFVRRIDVSYRGTPILMADLDFAISENPNLRFYFNAKDAGDLKVNVVDSEELKFGTSVKVNLPK